MNTDTPTPTPTPTTLAEQCAEAATLTLPDGITALASVSIRGPRDERLGSIYIHADSWHCITIGSEWRIDQPSGQTAQQAVDRLLDVVAERAEAKAVVGAGMKPEERVELEAQGFIVHSETRMHLPELTDLCVDCLRAEVDRLNAENKLIRLEAARLDAERDDARAAMRELTADLTKIRPAALTIMEGWDPADRYAVENLFNLLARDPLTGLSTTAREALRATEGRQK